MILKKTKHLGEQVRIAGPFAQVIRPDPGQRQQPFRPARIGQRRGERAKRNRFRVAMVWRCADHRLSAGGQGLESIVLAKILVVEDNALNIKLFCDLLTAHGHEAEAVTDSREALDSARAFKPDLVITDIQLPHISGLELIELLKADPDLAHVPIMAVTAYAASGDEERFRAAGAQAYVSKPISVVRFVESVTELLESAGVPVESAPTVGPGDPASAQEPPT